MSRQDKIADCGAARLERRQWLAMLGGGGAAALAGCSDDGDGTVEATDGETDRSTFATAAAAPFTTLNPIYNTENGAGNAIARVLDQGYTFDGNDEYVPLLYDMSTEDGEVWTFELRDGLRFSDPYGAVTASDFAYLIREVHQSDWANSPATSSWRGVDVEETGEYEFRATLESPSLRWPESFDPLLYPVPKALLEPYVEERDPEGLRRDEELLELTFTGNLGPYILDDWRRGEGTRYSRNDEYYLRSADGLPDAFDNAPHFDSAAIRVIDSQAARLDALEAGDIDSATVPRERVEAYRDDDDIVVNRVPQPYTEKLSVNMRDNGWTAGPGNMFRHVEFRQAMAGAIDKNALIESVFRGFAEPNFTWQPRFSEFHPPEDEIPTFGVDDRYGSEYARGLAEEAFEKSAYEYGFDGEDMVAPDGDRVALDVYHGTDRETERLVAEFVAEELDANLGIDVSVEAVDSARFGDEYWSASAFPTPEVNADGEITEVPDELVDEVNGEAVEWTRPSATNPGPRSVTADEEWDMEVVFGLNTYPRTPITNEAFFDGATGFYNPVGYYPEFDVRSLFQDAREATSDEALRDAMMELFSALAEEQPYVTLAFPDSTVGYRAGLEGPVESFSNGWNRPAWRYG